MKEGSVCVLAESSELSSPVYFAEWIFSGAYTRICSLFILHYIICLLCTFSLGHTLHTLHYTVCLMFTVYFWLITLLNGFSLGHMYTHLHFRFTYCVISSVFCLLYWIDFLWAYFASHSYQQWIRKCKYFSSTYTKIKANLC